MQIIIIDDNSDPKLVDFENFPGVNREHVEIILNKKGRGAGYCRNIGLDKVKGVWVTFADADDVFETDALNKCMNRYMTEKKDVVYLNAELVDAQTMESKPDFPYTIHINSGGVLDQEWIRYGFTNPWAKFVKNSFIKTYNIRFDETIAGNDVMFSLLCGYYAQDIVVDTTVIYYWLLRRSGNITSNISKEAIMDKFDVAVRKNCFIYSKNIKSCYRVNLYKAFMRTFHMIGMSYFKAFFVITKKTTPRYVLADLCLFIRSYSLNKGKISHA